jgi:hypothetical protein
MPMHEDPLHLVPHDLLPALLDRLSEVTIQGDF